MVAAGLNADPLACRHCGGLGLFHRCHRPGRCIDPENGCLKCERQCFCVPTPDPPRERRLPPEAHGGMTPALTYDQRRSVIVWFHRLGYPVDDIAVAVGCVPTSVRVIMRELGITAPSPRPGIGPVAQAIIADYLAGMTKQKDLARKHGRSAARVAQILANAWLSK